MKTTRILSASGAALLSTAFLLALAPAAHATTFPDLTYNVTLNLSALSTYQTGPFSLDLQLLTGSGNQTNTVTLSSFVFTGGTATGVGFTHGNESGSVASSVILTSNTPNTATDNELDELFSSGVTQIGFKVDQTPNSETVSSGTPVPEEFNVAVLDSTGINTVYTTDPSGNGLLLTSPLGSTSTTSTVQQYTIEAVPEPNSGFLGFLAAGVMLGMLQLRRRFMA